ncbi:hypothetical protein MLD38_034478 [Melastoma candidum]|uniref:Uncharacterized protein n=1 Tax=Melastoma candidum TaxID=119954 RepID=A0ACB9MA23_9MYRT|nr:hypothetical protein MLD38_034478 [Melastoma candidum]
MAENAPTVRVTRSSKRRAEAVPLDGDEVSTPATKKRVVLGELKNLPNVLHPPTLQDGPVAKKTTKGKVGKRRKAPSSRVVLPAADAGSEEESGLVPVSAAGDPDIDVEPVGNDPQMCSAYVTDIYDYLRKMEVDPGKRPSHDYIEKIQKDVTANMRGILVDWLVEVAEEYKLLSDTLYLSISYIDKYLSSNVINRQKLQLLGVSAMLIASKYEEISPPHVEEFCYITDNTYTRLEVVKMEADILKSLKFEMGNPTVKTFLRRFNRIAQEGYKTMNLQLEFLGYYLAELSLLDYSCIKFLPSLVAASVTFLARFISRPKAHPWSVKLQEYSTYSPKDLKECVTILHDLYLSRKGGSLQAVREKYKQHKFKCVATMASPPEIPPAFFEDVKEIMIC